MTIVPGHRSSHPHAVDGIFTVVQRPVTAAEVAELEAQIPSDAIAVTRYMAAQMAHLDSER